MTVLSGESSDIKIFTFDFTENTQEKIILMTTTDCKILTSINENFPNVILESMVCGTPVIAFESSGVKEIIKNDNGILVKKEGIKNMVEKIENLQKIIHFKRLSTNAIKTIKTKFSSEIEIKKYIKIYNKILKKSK